MNYEVFAIACEDYEFNDNYNKLKKLLLDNNLLSFVKKDMLIAIKVNLVSASKPEKAVVTHPILVKALCKILIEMGAKVIVGDSPGGLYNESSLNNSYRKTNMNMILETNAKLNDDFSYQTINLKDGLIVKQLDGCNYLLKADAIINFAKMKTHGMMALSSCVKNMFGSVPGACKLQYHYKYPNHQDFANMLIDIQEYYKCKLHIVDAIVSMEGNGPTMGNPRKVGLILAGQNPYNIDLVCARLMNLDIVQVPTIQEAIKRKLSANSFAELSLNMNIDDYIVKDFLKIEHANNVQFYSNDSNIFKKLLGKMAKAVLTTKPQVNKKQCIGCQKCFQICPAKAITMKKNKPSINRKICIRCFCCQEFCPVGAMKTHQTFVAKIITKSKKSKN